MRFKTSRTEPLAVASTRRMATVATCTPEAATASSRDSRLETTPVPMIMRDVKTSPAISSRSSARSAAGRRVVSVRSAVIVQSSSLGGGEHLDVVVGTQHRGGPPAARHDVAVDGHGHAGTAPIEADHDDVDRRAVVEGSMLAVEHHVDHRTGSGANRAGENGMTWSSTRPVDRYVAVAAAVAGVSRTPLR